LENSLLSQADPPKNQYRFDQFWFVLRLLSIFLPYVV
jgi:hypothetical protein